MLSKQPSQKTQSSIAINHDEAKVGDRTPNIYTLISIDRTPNIHPLGSIDRTLDINTLVSRDRVLSLTIINSTNNLEIGTMQYQVFVRNRSESYFVASVVGMPNLTVEGRTEEEAIANAKAALKSQQRVSL
jgi:hypothetical protein